MMEVRVAEAEAVGVEEVGVRERRIDVQTVSIPAHADSGFYDARAGLDRLKVRLRQHRLECLDAWLRLWIKPMSTLLAIFAMGLVLALPAGLYLVLDNGRNLVQAWPMGNQISVYLKPELSDDQARALIPRMASFSGVAAVELVSKAQALALFVDQSEFAETIRSFEQNPLPALLEVRIDDKLSEFEFAELTRRLGQVADVDKVRVDAQWLQRLETLVEVAQRVLGLLSVALASILVLVVLSATRLAIQERQGEIAIKRLFGATRADLKRPFLYMGVWLGFWSSVLATLLVWFALNGLREPLSLLLSLYQTQVGFHQVSFTGVIALFVFGVGFAWLGAWIGTRQALV